METAAPQIASSFFTEELVQKIDDLRDDVAKMAEEVIRTKMPTKILHLTAMYSGTFSLPLDAVCEVGASAADGHHQREVTGKEMGATKKRKRVTHLDDETAKVDDSPHTSNQNIRTVMEVLKAEVLQCIDYLNTVKLWIQLNIPRIEDGNNFGVSIQEETISELTRSEDAGYNLLESMTKYYVTRGKLVTKVLKYPGIEDYKQSVIELDQKEYINLKLSCLDMRNNLAIVYDMLTKNIEKITKPRTSHSHAMY